ncbi:hypothetical protein T4B_15477 [Trichinella pseudospiralis]|uniref:Uncharacterized protein n=1 Tax=Trichinella pseudospiralis TaxID=6337 RepID=A0A0V1DPW7_TRIPS|nr:hypothetical protein T4A_13290 [Trichinella pseudospiralis]KRY96082.1 hypothetical protein T4B_15477 [Trichinella pseudospiralis]
MLNHRNKRITNRIFIQPSSRQAKSEKYFNANI